jgi:membrane-associated protein
VAGIGEMTYWRFTLYNIVGIIAWVSMFIVGGFYFGNLPLVKRDFTFVVFVIIIISVLPIVFEYFRQQSRSS